MIAPEEQRAVFPRLPKNLIHKSECKNAELRAIVFHDSFGVALEPFLSEHFKEVIYFWNILSINILSQKKLIEDFQPDVVIEERVERGLF